MQKKSGEIRTGMLKEIREIVPKTGQEEGYSCIADIISMLYYEKEINITDKVISKYNEIKK